MDKSTSLPAAGTPAEPDLARAVIDRWNLERDALLKLNGIATRFFEVVDVRKLSDRARALRSEYFETSPLTGERVRPKPQQPS
jgi:hypothetical protein